MLTVPIVLLVSASFKVVEFYLNLRTYPPGPLPLPLAGNLHLFLRKNLNILQIISDNSQRFGPVYTFWMGPMPHVIINDAKLAKEAFSKVDFAGRPLIKSYNEIAYGKDSINIINSDFNREWEVLRKVAHSAVRKFTINERLPHIIDGRVNSFLEEIKKQNGDGPFNPREYLGFLMTSLLATIAFGKKFEMDDPEFQTLNQALKTHLEKNDLGSMLVLFVPILRHTFMKKGFDEFYDAILTQRNYTSEQYREHLESYSDGTIRDFTDAMIFAKKEAEAEDSNDSKYLKDENVVNAVLDLFAAGSETTKLTLLWAFLFLAEYPKYQRAIREEVEEALGSDEVPTHEHRSRCNLLQAFILEVMRFKPLFPLGVAHKTTVDTEIGGQKIKKDVAVMISLEVGFRDKEVWGDPDVFRPERFLDANGKFVSRPNQLFFPFGGGRRVCLGERLALTNMYFVLAGLMNKTKGQFFCFPSGPGSVDMTPEFQAVFNVSPRQYELILAPDKNE